MKKQILLSAYLLLATPLWATDHFKIEEEFDSKHTISANSNVGKPQDDFQGIKELRLGSVLLKIPPEIVGGWNFNNLWRLGLSIAHWGVLEGHKGIQKLPSLTKLDITHADLRFSNDHVPLWIGKMSRLTGLDFNCSEVAFPEGFFKGLTGLKELHLGYCPILPKGVGALENLKSIDFNSRPFMQYDIKIPGYGEGKVSGYELEPYIDLKKIQKYLREKAPENYGQAEWEKYFKEKTFNNIKVPPETLSDLKRLRISFSGCTIVPSFFARLNNLQTLEIAGQFASTFEDYNWEHFSQLRSLNFKCGFHGSFPQGITKLTSLESLNVGDFVKNIPSLNKLQSLTELHISTEDGDEVPDMTELTRLKKLGLAHMKKGAYVRKIPESLEDLNLYCSHVDPDFMGFLKLTNLRKLYLDRKGIRGTPFMQEYQHIEALSHHSKPIHQQLKEDIMKEGLKTAEQFMVAIQSMQLPLELLGSSTESFPALRGPKIQTPLNILLNVGALLTKRLSAIAEEHKKPLPEASDAEGSDESTESFE